MVDIEEREGVGTGLDALLRAKAEVFLRWVGAVVTGENALADAVVEVVKSRPLVRLKKRLRWPIRLRVFQGFVGRELGFSLLSAAFWVDSALGVVVAARGVVEVVAVFAGWIILVVVDKCANVDSFPCAS